MLRALARSDFARQRCMPNKMEGMPIAVSVPKSVGAARTPQDMTDLSTYSQMAECLGRVCLPERWTLRPRRDNRRQESSI